MRKGAGADLPDDNGLCKDSSKSEIKYLLTDPIWDERWIPKEKEDET